MESILPTPQWPPSLCAFVTQCLLWDPKARPTSVQALQHEFFKDAVDPLKIRSSTPSLLRKAGELSSKPSQENVQGPHLLSTKPSWFRKSFIGSSSKELLSPQANSIPTPGASPIEPPKKNIDKRATWHPQRSGAPMPILPTIRPISPLSDAVTAQAAKAAKEDKRRSVMDEKAIKKIGRQLSVASSNHYNDKSGSVNNNGQLVSPPPGKESLGFFSHLRKRARRLSGRPNMPSSPNSDDLEAQAGCAPWGGSARSSMILDHASNPTTSSTNDMRELDRAIRAVDGALDDSNVRSKYSSGKNQSRTNISFPPTPNTSRSDTHSQSGTTFSCSNGQVTSRTTRRPAIKSQVISTKYDTPMENDELLDEEVFSYGQIMKRMDGKLSIRTSSSSVKGYNAQQVTPPYQSYNANNAASNTAPIVPRTLRHSQSTPGPTSSSTNKHSSVYLPSKPTISPLQHQSSASSRHSLYAPPNLSASTLPHCLQAARPLDVPGSISSKTKTEFHETSKWPTPPYEENWLGTESGMRTNI